MSVCLYILTFTFVFPKGRKIPCMFHLMTFSICNARVKFVMQRGSKYLVCNSEKEQRVDNMSNEEGLVSSQLIL